MKMVDRETVDGTRVTIGRRVQARRVAGERIERVSKTYSAEYLDVGGKRRIVGLGVSNRREARRRAIGIQRELDLGQDQPRQTRVKMTDLAQRFAEFNANKGLAPKTLAKYRAETDKLLEFCAGIGLVYATRFDESVFYQFGAWLRQRVHKQGTGHASKSVFVSMAFAKQLFNWAWRSRILPDLTIRDAKLPSARARPQPCFSDQQIDELLERSDGLLHHAIAMLAYTGMRVGELEQLHWVDVHLDHGELGMLHIRRGGSAETTKDKEPRFIPIFPQIRPIFESLPRDDPLVLPDLRARTMLTRLKRLCVELGYGEHYKTHSLRHYFASLCANSSISYRLALAWMGHSSSKILDLYYHLHDAESQAAMKRLADESSQRRERAS